MSVLRVPTFETPFYSQTTALDGVNYRLRFKYNQREDCWYLSIGTTDGIDLVNGVKLVVGIPLLRLFPDERLPPGDLMVYSDGTSDGPPGLLELGAGKRCELWYFDRSEYDV